VKPRVKLRAVRARRARFLGNIIGKSIWSGNLPDVGCEVVES